MEARGGGREGKPAFEGEAGVIGSLSSARVGRADG